MPLLVRKQRHTRVRRQISHCKGNTPSHCATNYLYRLFFLQVFTSSTSYSPTSTYPKLTISLLQAQCCTSIIHTNSQENQSWSQICLKLFWHTTKPKAMPFHGTWLLSAATGFAHCSFLELSVQEFPLQHSQHRMSWGRHFQSNLSLCALAWSLLPGLSGGCSLREETFPSLKIEPEDSV